MICWRAISPLMGDGVLSRWPEASCAPRSPAMAYYRVAGSVGTLRERGVDPMALQRIGRLSAGRE